MTLEIKHFTQSEFTCSCCGKTQVTTALVYWLEIFRRALGLPVKINSGYRCKAHNSSPQVGGSALSRHMIGCAADLALPAGIAYSDFVNLARRLSESTWEIVSYPAETYLHFGVPREHQTRLWTGEKVISL